MAKKPSPRIQAAIDFFGSVSAWAAAVDVKYMTVRQWIARDNVPLNHAVSTETASAGGVTKESLRPDVSWPKQKPKKRVA
jgi:DNA-binding transcriptional regulator YdaS (Cro superfamily)